MDQPVNSSPGGKFAIPLILVVGMLARIYWFWYNPSLWNDEVSLANNIIKFNFSKIAVTPLDDAQAAPPGYLLVEKLFGQGGGYSEHSLRLLSLLCGFAALILFASLARQLLVGVGRLLAVALFSFSGPLIYHSSEVKQYQMEVLATVVLLWMAVRFREKIKIWQAVACGIAGMLCVVSANSAIFVVSGAFGVVAGRFLITKQYRSAAHAGIVLGLSLAAFFAYYFLILHRNPNVAQLKTVWADHFAPLPDSPAGCVWYIRTTFFALVNPLGLSLDLDLPFLPHPTALKYILSLSLGGLGLFVLGVIVYLRKDRYRGGLILSALITTLAASLLGQYPLDERLILFLAPVVYLTIGKAAELAGGDAARGAGRLCARVLVALASVYFMINFAAKISHPAWFGGVEKYSQMREAIHFIAQNRQKNDPVYIMWSTAKFYDYYNYREKLDWPVIVGTDPRAAAHSEEDVAANAQREIHASVAGGNRTWFLLQDIFTTVKYRDQNGTMHETATPTAAVFKGALAKEPAQITETFTGHAAAAYLMVKGT
jgi:hypothetical protein